MAQPRVAPDLSPAAELRRVVRDVRRHYRWKVALQGLAVVVPAVVLAVVVAAFVMDRLRFQSGAVLTVSLGVYLVIAALTLWFLGRPLRRRVSDEQVSLYIEEHEPGLAGELVTAVEFAEREGATVSPDLVRQLVQGAVARAAGLDARQVERPSVLKSSGLLAGTSVAMLALALINPSFLRNGLTYLLQPIARRVAANPYSIAVTPGDTLIARGADLKITAQLRNFGAEQVEVVVRHSEDGPWEHWPMVSDAATGRQTLLLFKVQQASEYYVAAGGVRSRTYHVAVANLPYAKEVDLTYHYPAYTGLADERQENTGDIAAIAGTRVTVEITPTFPVSAGALLLGTDSLALAAAADGKLSAAITVQRPGSYRVALRADNGMLVVASQDYTIDVLADRKPTVRLTKPGRDTRATTIEEVFTEAQAQDDYGVHQLDFVYSVNGGPQRVERLYSASGDKALKRVTAGHTFYLEELGLKPGDFISYFARASDARGAGGTAASDIYFLEIRPFDRTFRQGDQGGGGDQQSPGNQVGELSQRQRDIVAGTFRMVRDSATFSDKDYRENLGTLTLAQGKLRDDVKLLLDRMQSRGVIQLDSTLKTVGEALPPAIAAMTQAEEQLGERKANPAMPPEQQALQYLQRAEEAFREREITRQQGGGRGQNSERAQTDELGELFNLELDRQRNQYEEVQRGQRQQADQQVDATLERLKELARRQQQENERMRTQAAEPGTPSGGSGGQGQRALADSAAELARQLERLSREQQRDDLSETARQLRQAADQMRRAAANGSGGTPQGNAALERLDDARRLLEQGRSGSLKRDVQDALNRADHLTQQERGVSDDVNRLANDSTNPAGRSDRVLQLMNRKADMANQVKDLVNDLDRMARESRQDQPDASKKLRDAAQGARTSRLEDMINYSRGVIQSRTGDFPKTFEQQIGSNVQTLHDRVQDALGAIGESRDQRLERNLDKTRDVTNALESLGDRMGQPGQQQGGQGDGRTGGQQQRGQQGQGEAGRQGPVGQGGGQGLGANRMRNNSDRQLRDDLRQQTQQLRQLRDDMRKDGVDVGQLNQAIDALGRMDNTGAIGAPKDVTQLKGAIVQGLKEFEFNLRRQLAGGNQPLFGAGSDDVPPEYRKLVEQYYKSLAQQKK